MDDYSSKTSTAQSIHTIRVRQLYAFVLRSDNTSQFLYRLSSVGGPS